MYVHIFKIYAHMCFINVKYIHLCVFVCHCSVVYHRSDLLGHHVIVVQCPAATLVQTPAGTAPAAAAPCGEASWVRRFAKEKRKYFLSYF